MRLGERNISVSGECSEKVNFIILYQKQKKANLKILYHNQLYKKLISKQSGVPRIKDEEQRTSGQSGSCPYGSSIQLARAAIFF